MLPDTKICLAWLSSSLPADSAEPIPLRYQFTPGQTNAYSVKFETVINEQPTTVAGIVYVDIRRVEDGVAAVGLSGALLPRATPGAGLWQGAFHPRMGGWFPRPIHLRPELEARVDEMGQVIRQWTFWGANLPAPIGSLVAEGARMTAFHRLQSAEVEEPTAELLAAAVRLAHSSDSNARLAAGRILSRHGTANEVPVMVRLLA
jgi:hypothetical protein